MSDSEMNSYRLTLMIEPGDERMAQIMRDVAEDACESTHRSAERAPAPVSKLPHSKLIPKWEKINAKRVANRVLNGGHDMPIPE